MKLFFVALVAVLAVVQADNICTSRTCGDSTSHDNPGGDNDPCFCDEGCEDAEDCCDSYYTECIDSGCAAVDACGESTEQTDADGACYCDEQCSVSDDCCSNYGTICDTDDTGDTACASCPDGPQQDTTSTIRGSCYCDESCLIEDDCCPSFKKYCGDVIVQSDRAAFCNILDGSAHAFCDNVMREAYFFIVEPKIDAALTEATWDLAAIYDTYDRTCVADPEVIEGEVETCYTDDNNNNWRYGCAGLASVWAQECSSDSCRESGCDGAWRRDFWGVSSFVEAAQGAQNDFPAEFAGGADDSAGRLPSTAGQCLFSFDDTNCVQTKPINRANAWVYGCSASEYTDVEYLDWEKAVENSEFVGPGKSYVAILGNGDSTLRRQSDLLLALSPFPWTQAFTDTTIPIGGYTTAC